MLVMLIAALAEQVVLFLELRHNKAHSSSVSAKDVGKGAV